ncbi:MAG: tetratricopeptide repeat protein [Planctomycetes bacterium]|nr:tetratricopeptide repeat protein [Planctomycetota bacterium]
MLPKEEERFLKLAHRLGVLQGDRLERAAKVAERRSEGKVPLPFTLLREGILSDEEVDRILHAMVELLDQTTAKAAELLKDRQFTKAIGKYDRVIASHPSHEASYWGRAEAYLKKGALLPALADYTTLLEITEKKALAHNRRGVVLARLGKHDEARREQEAALSLDPANAEIHFDLGTCFHILGDRVRAVAEYSRTIEIAPDHLEALNNRAILHLLGRDFEKAQADWKACLAIDRRRSTIRHNLKMLLQRLRPAR